MRIISHINIGILHYKTIDKTILCVESIIATASNAHIYIIDNYSNDGSLEKLKEKYIKNENILFLCLDANKGFACANNYCMRFLKARGEKHVILTNNDIIFTKNSILQLIDTLNYTNAILVAPKVLNPDGKIMDSVQSYLYKNIFNYWEIRIKYFLCPPKKTFAEKNNKAVPIKTFSGCCFVCNLDKMEAIDYMDEHTFLYYEEPILAAKIDAAGYCMIYEPLSSVIHFHGATTTMLNEIAVGHMLESKMYYMKCYLRVNKYVLAFYIYIRRVIDYLKYHSEMLYNKESDVLKYVLS